MPVSAALPKRVARSLRGPRHQRSRHGSAVRIAHENRPRSGTISGPRRSRRTDFCDRPGSLVRLSWTRRSQPSCLDQLSSPASAGMAVPECHGCGRQRRVFTLLLYPPAPEHSVLRPTIPTRSPPPPPSREKRSPWAPTSKRFFPGCFPLPVSASGFWCGHCPWQKRACAP